MLPDLHGNVAGIVTWISAFDRHPTSPALLGFSILAPADTPHHIDTSTVEGGRGSAQPCYLFISDNLKRRGE